MHDAATDQPTTPTAPAARAHLTRAARIRALCGGARVTRYTLDLDEPDVVRLERRFESEELALRWCEHVGRAALATVGLALLATTSVARDRGTGWVGHAALTLPPAG